MTRFDAERGFQIEGHDGDDGSVALFWRIARERLRLVSIALAVHSGSFTERLREFARQMAVIAEACFLSHSGNGAIGFDEELARLPDPKLAQVFCRT